MIAHAAAGFNTNLAGVYRATQPGIIIFGGLHFSTFALAHNCILFYARLSRVRYNARNYYRRGLVLSFLLVSGFEFPVSGSQNSSGRISDCLGGVPQLVKIPWQKEGAPLRNSQDIVHKPDIAMDELDTPSYVLVV